MTQDRRSRPARQSRQRGSDAKPARNAARCLRAAVAALGLGAAALDGHAQPIIDPIPERRGAAPALPDRAPVPPAPAQPAPAAVEEAPAPPALAPLFVLRGLRLQGSSLFGAAEETEVASPFLNRPVGPFEIEAMRRAATLLYVRRGLVNSGFVLPDQTVADGVLTLHAVEGRIAEIEVEGTRMLHPGWVRAQLRQGLGTPFDLGALERQQRLMLRDPFLERLNLSVEPGLVPGEARLRAEVAEARPVRLSLGLANNQPASTGELRGTVGAVATGLLGTGDVLALQYGNTDGADDYGLAWSVPLWPDDTRLNLRFDRNRALVVEPALAALGIRSRYDAISVGISRPFYRTPDAALTLGVALDWRETRTSLLGFPFDFTPGSEGGKTTVAALRLTQDWLDQGADAVLALRSTVSIGLDAFGATRGSGPVSGQFTAWLGQAQYVRRLPWEVEGLLRGSLQLSADPLLTIEQFPLGGIATVRGYRENRVIADNAAVATAELRVPIAMLTPPLVEPAPGIGLLQLVPFIDAGTGWNTDRPSPEGATLLSLGAGLRWRPARDSLIELYWGRPLRERERGNTLQEQGVHLRLTIGVL